MEYSLNAGAWNSVFAVPAVVVDDYIKLASGDSLRVLLYMLRHGGKTLTAERMKADLGIESDGELEDAVTFWTQRGIISASAEKGAVSLSAAAPENAAINAPTAVSEPALIASQNTVRDTACEAPPKVIAAKPPTYSNGEIARCIKDSPGMKMLFDEAEKLYARTLRDSERQLIMKLAEHYRLPSEVSLMLLQYCFRIEKTGSAYILKLAEDWANSEISTIQQADERIRALEKLDDAETRMREALGLKSRLSASMREYLRVWTIDWGFGTDMIQHAYDKTIETTGSWSFAYANSILESWRKAGIATVAAAEKADEEYRRAKTAGRTAAEKMLSGKRAVKANTGKSSSFDTDMLRTQIMNNYKK